MNFTYIKKADGIVLVYDPSEEDEQLKENLDFWFELIDNNSDILEKKECLWLVGNNKNNNNEINKIEEQKRIENLKLAYQIKEHRIIILNKINTEIEPVNVNYFFYF